MYAVIDRLNKRVCSTHPTYIAAESAEACIRRHDVTRAVSIVQVENRSEADAIVYRLVGGAS